MPSITYFTFHKFSTTTWIIDNFANTINKTIMQI